MAGSNDSTLNNFFVSTLRRHRKGFVENILTSEALIFQVKERGLVRKEKGGRAIIENLLYGTNDTVKAFDGFDRFSLKPQTGFTAAEYAWKHMGGSVSISGEQEFLNSGSEEQVFNYLNALRLQLELSVKQTLNSHLYGDGTADGGKAITGLAAAVEDGTAWSTYAGINGATTGNEFWRNQWLNFDTFSSSSTFVTNSGQSQWGIKAMRRMARLCSIARTKPTLIITTGEIWENYLECVEEHYRTENRKLADLGFENASWMGIPIIYDLHMDSGEMLFLNSQFCNLVIGEGREFVFTDFERPEDQDAKVGLLLWTGNLTLSRRDVHGRITNIS